VTDIAAALTEWETRCTAQGLFITAPRRAILTALLHLDDACDAVALLQSAREHYAGTSMGTVYRFLRDLEQRGLAQAHAQPHGRIRWNLRSESPVALQKTTGDIHAMLDQLQDFMRDLEKIGLAGALRTPAPITEPSPLHPAEREPERATLYLLQRIAEHLGYRPHQQANPTY